MVDVVPFNGFNCKYDITINFYNEKTGLKTKHQKKFIKMLDTVKHVHIPHAYTYIHPSPHSHETCTLPYPTGRKKYIYIYFTYNVNLTTTQ